jgi:hypothetical protein
MCTTYINSRFQSEINKYRHQRALQNYLDNVPENSVNATLTYTFALSSVWTMLHFHRVQKYSD